MAFINRKENLSKRNKIIFKLLGFELALMILFCLRYTFCLQSVRINCIPKLLCDAFFEGVKWRQGMWSKEENEQLKENILEYCQVG